MPMIGIIRKMLRFHLDPRLYTSTSVQRVGLVSQVEAKHRIQ